MRFLSQLYEHLGLSPEKGLVEIKDRKKWVKCVPTGVTFLSKTVEQLNIIKPDAFYHFNGVPLILFFENPVNEDVQRIHGQSWCFNQAPVIFILKDGTINIYNAFRYKKGTALQKLDITDTEISRRFSSWELQSGNTWKWIENTFFKRGITKHRVDRYLLDNIRTAVALLEERELAVGLAHRIILRLIFSRYLIDRGVIIDEKYIPGKPGDKETRKAHFNRLISHKPMLFRFFAYLKERFNGNLFEIHDDEYKKVRQDHLDRLSRLFKGEDQETGEQTLFDVYDFSIIPIELISGIYESIIDDKKRKANSAIYTPTFLVEYILRQTVEAYLKENHTKHCKILDPACGSGIFLVEAFRRMVEKEKSSGAVTDKKLIELLENNIYGIDKDEAALNVAIFSLYVAVLDYKEPKDINKLKLPELLNKKLFTADFFDTGHKFNDILKKNRIQFIVGNPPWGSNKSKPHLRYLGNYPVTDFQIAQTFLIRAKDFSNENTLSALVVTSTVIHNAEKFRSYFLDNFFIDKVLDLSAVRRLIFKDAINPSAVIFYRFAHKRDTKQNNVRYLSLKPNIFFACFNTLVIERTDIKTIKQHYFIKYHWMWKVALYGSELDFHLLVRLDNPDAALENFIGDNPGIFKGKGIFTGVPKPSPFTFLTGLPIIETKKITKYYTTIDRDTPRLKSEDTFLERGRKPGLFQGEHVFLRRRMLKETELVVSYNESPCAFRDSTYSLASQNQPDELKELYGIFISDLFTYYQYMTSANWGVYFPEVNLEEYLSFPYVQVEDRKEFAALVNRFINYYKKFYTGVLRPEDIALPGEFKQINQMVNDAYEIDEIEKDLIDYVLEVSRYLFQENKIYGKALRRVNNDDLEQYARVFYNHFGNIYSSPGEYFQVEYFLIDYFAAMKFKIVPFKPQKGKEIVKSEETDPDKIIFKALAQETSLYTITDRLYLNKVVNGFEEDFFYIIKPNEFKSWHRATAHMDLMEFVDAINKSELKQMERKNSE
jgi:hypothetical protein